MHTFLSIEPNRTETNKHLSVLFTNKKEEVYDNNERRYGVSIEMLNLYSVCAWKRSVFSAIQWHTQICNASYCYTPRANATVVSGRYSFAN